MLLIFATRFDPVTERTHRIANLLLERVKLTAFPTLCLFETQATHQELSRALAEPISIAAFYSHGDEDGKILGQGRQPCWNQTSSPWQPGVVVFAFACRAMRWLSEIFETIKCKMIIGYREDLMFPISCDEKFWLNYENIHAFIPEQLAKKEPIDKIQAEFRTICTQTIRDVEMRQGGLLELVALLRSRDGLEVVPMP